MSGILWYLFNYGKGLKNNSVYGPFLVKKLKTSYCCCLSILSKGLGILRLHKVSIIIIIIYYKVSRLGYHKKNQLKISENMQIYILYTRLYLSFWGLFILKI